jgi:hypothetical protein
MAPAPGPKESFELLIRQGFEMASRALGQARESRPFRLVTVDLFS